MNEDFLSIPIERRIITDTERYEFLKNCAYKIYAFSNGKHFEISFQTPGYSPSEFDNAIDAAIINLEESLKK